MEKPFLSRTHYIFLFSLLGIVNVAGLFVPLLDNDAAHHANIALRMYLTGDYVTLADQLGEYLDKPHLHFWLSAASFHVFGVNGFAYKLPSLLFSIGGIYSVYRAGKLLYNEETGKLASLILASSFSFLLANSDVRMDAIITATIAFSFWQLAVFIKRDSTIHLISAALGLALGFSTKGMIAVFIPLAAAAMLAVQLRGIRFLFNYRWIALPLLFLLFIFPVLYCYYLQFNLHPEKIIRGRDHIDGVRFILFNQNVERFTGGMGDTLRRDYFFFFHSFLWTYAPWCLLAAAALYTRFRHIKDRQQEWASAGIFLLIIVMVSFSGFKLPHYLNISFPFASLFTAAYITDNAGNDRWGKNVYRLQLVIGLLVLLALAGINFWSFQVHSYIVMAGLILLLSVYFYYTRSSLLRPAQKAVGVSAAVMILCFFLLNTNFFPGLLRYQAGNMAATAIKGKADPGKVYFWKGSNSASFDFYTKTIRKEYNPADTSIRAPIWLAFYPKDENDIQAAGIKLINRLVIRDYEISKLDLRFMDPQRRDSACSSMTIAEIAP